MTAENVEHATLTLFDGTLVLVRPIRPSDLQALQRFHLRLSQHSIYLRFFGIVPELSDDRARYFTHVDGVERFALVATEPTSPGEIIAVTRFDHDPDTTGGEYACIVEDRWQGRGLGLALTRSLIEAARRRGYRAIFALVLPENVRMVNLLKDLGLPERVRWVEGVQRIEVDISRPEKPAVD
ncbi:MAG TPA: GNAT family N-acetyltransferase [Thermomicrobiaceae bacterium]|nr:GNAT family N-acetyltransferase [Thermomicrobiaceae bacterium]